MPGFPARLEGVWSKMEACLARLSLILRLWRVAEQGGEEQVEAKDMLAASVLLDPYRTNRVTTRTLAFSCTSRR